MKRDFLLGGTKLPTGGAVRGAGGAMSPPVFMLKEALVQDMFHRPGPADCGIIKISGKWPRSIALRVSMFIGLRLRCVVEKSGFVPC